MSSFGIGFIKNALSRAFEDLKDWQNLSKFEKGKVIDQSFKSLMKDLMKQFNMTPGVDYVDNLADNEPITDFVALSKKADDLIQGLLTGKVIAVSGHSRVSKLGKDFTVKPYFKKVA